MRKKLIIGWTMFVAGIALEVVFEIAGIWIIDFTFGVLWKVGMVVCINASLSLDYEKKRENKVGGDSLRCKKTEDTGDGRTGDG